MHATRSRPLAALALLALVTAAVPALAQRGASGPGVRRLATPQTNLTQPAAPGAQAALGTRRAIVLTGYWPPSNEAVRRFSPNPAQNPQGWIGQNWENRGYDVYAYFPEFSPPTCTSCGAGTGDLTVDYQDTSADFWPIVNSHQPIAIITHSRTGAALSWEVEMNSYNFSSWTNDYMAPLQPTPSPPDASVPAGHLRLSTLPVQEIVDDVIDANLGLNAFICFSQSSGGFLSGYMAYHGCWYQSLHATPGSPDWCIAAGHVHVGSGIPWPTAQRAAEVTLRTVIRHVDEVRYGGCHDVDLYCATTANSAGQGAMLTTSGSTSIGANSLRFLVTNTPPNQAGSLIYGSAQGQTPWGNGTRCVAPPFQRLGPIQNSNASGFLDRTVDFALPPLGSGPYAVSPGTTWYFQYVYRDPAAGGANFDATNGVAVTFCP